MDMVHQATLDMYGLMCRLAHAYGHSTGSLNGRRDWSERPDAAALPALRKEITERLHECQETLSQVFPEKTAYRILFAFTVYFDEVIQTGLTPAESTQWQMLQMELYGTDKGGELFFDALDEALATEQPILVYEAYYFCLSLGFRGRLAGNDSGTALYRNALEAKFERPEELAPESATAVDKPKTYRRHSYLWYYAAAVTGNIACWFLIKTVG